MRLENKVALITGSASGIGRATAALFAKEGARVVVVDISDKGKDTVELIRKMGGQAIFVKGDVTKSGDVQKALQKTLEKYGKLDILYNNAGFFTPACKVHELSEDNWDKVIEVNLKGIFLFSKYALSIMLKNGGGSIVNTASIYGEVASVGASNYCASKAGVILLTKTMALEYAKDNIRVNCVCPAAIVTPLHADALAGTAKEQEAVLKRNVFFIPKVGELIIGSQMEKEHLARHPMGRFGGPVEVANAVLFLASDEASYITGTALLVDGAYTAL